LVDPSWVWIQKDEKLAGVGMHTSHFESAMMMMMTVSEVM
jgi:hypothetical protein